MKRVYTLLTAVLTTITSQVALGQCVDKFPYSYDFETFDSLQTDAACDVSVVGDSAAGWY